MAGWMRVGIVLKGHHSLATRFIKPICGPGQEQIRVRGGGVGGKGSRKRPESETEI